MRRCLVIGGGGFIGRHVVSLLAEAGHEVCVLGRRPEKPDGLHNKCRYISGDYGNRSTLKEILTPGCEVIDLAYSTVPKTSYEDAIYDLLSNLPASVGLFQEALAAGVSRLLIVSSGGTVYGPPEYLPINEGHPTAPISPYGITKLTTDRYAMMFHRNAGLPVVIVRPANAYGADQKTGVGQGFLATAIQAVLSGREIEIYGAQGTIRDFIHVTDIATGIVAALEKGKEGTIYNIGTGRGTSTRQLVSMLESLAQNDGLSVRSKILPSRQFDVEANVLDSSKLTAHSGWVPKASLGIGVEEMWHAVKSR